MLLTNSISLILVCTAYFVNLTINGSDFLWERDIRTNGSDF